MTCQSCKNWKGGTMNAHGFGACANGKSYEFLPAQHSCPSFTPLEAPALAKRLAWLKNKKVK